ncbi:hypothetical protein G6321_00003395 (plasmid) [Bradyrhizobium barranii subsp. barranii]|uniref:Nucleoside 2-deoxyribosyltransferase n=1 Tax=Bradyrhizobium barranii subsp. barranii TaxID=2823807 RepID=A0A7Z0TX92_9BRAD|nr:hypothetical protein [Bradyrhizobium barranii]UGX89844.1 hypothetical protein G6321_00003395 [Bradyrhizobium barranii subsp. barranii]
MRIYIACALTHVPRGPVFDEHVSFIHQLAENLKMNGHEVKYALVDSDPQLDSRPFDERARLCYLWDRSMVEEAELMIAEASWASTGLGIEMQIAENKGIPIIVCFKDFQINRVKTVTYENPDHTSHHLQVGDGIITLMALGVPNIFRLIEYFSPDDGVAQIIGALDVLDRQ